MLVEEVEQHAAALDGVTDEQLVARVLGGERHLYAALMRRNNQRVYRAIRSVLRDEAEVEDVMQEAYVNAFAHLASFRGTARFSTWLIRIALYESYARVRARRRVAPMTEEEDDMSTMDATPEDRAGDRELGQFLERAIDALPESFRTVFLLRAVEELSTAETAEALDIPEDTVKTRLHRARAILQRSLLDRADAATPAVFGFHLDRCARVVDRVSQRLGIALG